MTVNANDGQISITATGGETTLNFDFLIYTSADLLVRKRATDGTLTTLTITTDYTVPGGSINNPAGGSISLVTPAVAGEVYTLASDVAESRTADFQQAGDLKASTLNSDLDKLTRVTQQLRRDVDAAVRIPTGGVNIDAGNVKIVNLGAATEATDAVTLADAQAILAASGNVPAPIASQIGSLLEATGTGTFAWRGGTSDVASAGTVDLAATTTRRVVITGTTTITSFGMPTSSGQFRFIRFTGALTLTHNATLLHLPGQANITTAAEDRAIFVSRGSNGWECYAYVRANGKPIIANLPTELGSMSQARLLGRLPGAGSGSPQELTLGSGAAGLLDDADAAAMRSTLELTSIATQTYETGVFTPTIAGTTLAGAGTYTGNRSGRYTRIGDVVYFHIRCEWSAHTGTGNMILTGLPITAAAISCTIQINNNGIASPASSQVKGVVTASTTQINFFSEVVSTGSLAALAIDTAADITINGFYFV